YSLQLSAQRNLTLIKCCQSLFRSGKHAKWIHVTPKQHETMAVAATRPIVAQFLASWRGCLVAPAALATACPARPSPAARLPAADRGSPLVSCWPDQS